MTLFGGTVERTVEGRLKLTGTVEGRLELTGTAAAADSTGPRPLVLSLAIGAGMALLLVVAALAWYFVRGRQRRARDSAGAV